MSQTRDFKQYFQSYHGDIQVANKIKPLIIKKVTYQVTQENTLLKNV